MVRKLFPTGCCVFYPFVHFFGVSLKNRKYPVFKCWRKILLTTCMSFLGMLNNLVKLVLRCMTSRLSYFGSKVEQTGTPSAITDGWHNFGNQCSDNSFLLVVTYSSRFFNFFGVTFKKPRKYPVFKCVRKTFTTVYMSFSEMLNDVVRSVLWCMTSPWFCKVEYRKRDSYRSILDIWQSIEHFVSRNTFLSECYCWQAVFCSLALHSVNTENARFRIVFNGGF